jgi:hypothetical protein
LTAPCFFDWLDSLIGPSGLLLVVSHLLPVPVFLWVGLEKKLVTEKWTREIFLQGHILSVDGDALSVYMVTWTLSIASPAQPKDELSSNKN